MNGWSEDLLPVLFADMVIVSVSAGILVLVIM